MSDEPLTPAAEPRHARGLELLERLGEDSFAGLLAGGGDLGRLVVDFVFGDVYARPGLSLRDRELVAVAMLAALGAREPQLDSHMRAALAAGVGADELREVVVQTAVFAGFPAALDAMRRFEALER
jgi:4-carboxymuconolactone decarboxylase